MQTSAVSADGQNVVLDFQFRGSFVLALDAAIRGLPSQVCIRAATPCTLRVWPYELRREAAARHWGWQELETRLVEEAFIRKNQRYISLRTRSARERLIELATELPEEWRRIPQHLVASHLAITPQYLSALKRSLGRHLP
jgi:CRP-like cAMP-binding protein